MNQLVAMYSPKIITTLVYMLQASEYHVLEYLAWLHRTWDFSSVIKRKKLVFTNKALLLFGFGALIYVAAFGVIVMFIFQGGPRLFAALGLFLLLPYLLAYILVIPLVIGNIFIQKPKEKRLLEEAGVNTAFVLLLML